jgi:hypothetical protein
MSLLSFVAFNELYKQFAFDLTSIALFMAITSLYVYSNTLMAVITITVIK